jgi:hypothetical protein
VIITTHVATGAVIGLAYEGRPVKAFTAGFASHFMLDSIPHWGGTPGAEYEASVLRVAKADGISGLVLIAGLLAVAPPRTRLSVAAAILGAVTPDLGKPITYFTGKVIDPKWFARIHNNIQDESPSRFRREITVAASTAITALLAVKIIPTLRSKRAA